MHLQMIFLLAACVIVTAAASAKKTDDLLPAEGRRHYAQVPEPLYASSHSYDAPKPRSGYVTSYSRRGSSSSGSGGHLGGPSYRHAPELRRVPAYSGPRDYAHAEPMAVVALPPSYGIHDAGISYATEPRGYGPPNSISAHSQRYSQDPNYDPAKDPVSQYAEYIPVREYGPGPRKHSDNRELSIYGYKK